MNDPTPEQRLWHLWRQGNAPSLREVLSQFPDATPSQITAAIGVDQYERWQRGERPLAEEYLPLLPPGPDFSQAACDVIYGEFLMREQLGQQPRAEEFLARFPTHADALMRQLEVHRALALTPAPYLAAPRLPAQPPEIPGYIILDEIGRGGMGIVFRARQESLDREVALKVLRVPEDDSATLERMRREAQMTARLSHPHIVSIFDAGQADGFYFFAMELVTGEDLHRRVSRLGPLAPEEAEQYLREAADALSHAHAAGLVHRDIKPSNLMIGPGGLKLLDLGLARRAGAANDSGLTHVGSFMGTPDYIAPEQANDPRLAEPRSDLYSLGCTFFYALTGKPPFEGDTPLAKLMQHHAGQVPSPLVHRPDLPAPLVAILARLMAKQPADRFSSADALMRALSPAAPVSLGRGPRVELLHRFQVSDWVKSLAFSPDGRWLAAVGLDRRVRLYNLFNGNLAWDTRTDAGLLSVVFSPDGQSLAVGSEDRRVYLYDVAGRSLRWQAAGHLDQVNAVAFVSRGVRVLSASHDGSLRLWNGKDGQPRREWLAHSGAVWGLATTPDGLKALSIGQDCLMHLWEVGDGTLSASWPPFSAMPNSVALSNDGSQVLAGFSDGSIGVWSLRDRQPISLFNAHSWKVATVCWSSGNALFLSGGRDNLVNLWELGNTTPLLKLSEHNRWVSSVAWCPGEPLFASGGADKQICVWRLEDNGN
jgi:serine/threonine protein kinase